MPSQFDQTFEAAAAPLFDQWFGVTVQLRRGVNTSEEFTASWALQEYQSLDEKVGLPIALKKRVYRFLKSDAVIDGETIEPRAGDVIIDGDNEFPILPVDKKPAVESEPGGYRWLVRTNKLA